MTFPRRKDKTDLEGKHRELYGARRRRRSRPVYFPCEMKMPSLMVCWVCCPFRDVRLRLFFLSAFLSFAGWRAACEVSSRMWWCKNNPGFIGISKARGWVGGRGRGVQGLVTSQQNSPLFPRRGALFQGTRRFVGDGAQRWKCRRERVAGHVNQHMGGCRIRWASSASSNNEPLS